MLREGRTASAAQAAQAWRATVAYAGQIACVAAHQGQLRGPVRLAVLFLRCRPRSHVRRDGSVRPSAPAWPDARPDSSKYLRALEDALTGICWDDDARIVHHQVSKEWAQAPGAAVAFGLAELWTSEEVWLAVQRVLAIQVQLACGGGRWA